MYSNGSAIRIVPPSAFDAEYFSVHRSIQHIGAYDRAPFPCLLYLCSSRGNVSPERQVDLIPVLAVARRSKRLLCRFSSGLPNDLSSPVFHCLAVFSSFI